MFCFDSSDRPWVIFQPGSNFFAAAGVGAGNFWSRFGAQSGWAPKIKKKKCDLAGGCNFLKLVFILGQDTNFFNLKNGNFQKPSFLV